MNATHVIVYTTPYCGYCQAAKRLLSRRGVPFEETDLAHDREARRAIIEDTGWRTVPVIVIVIDGKLVGGYQELAALDREGGLARLAQSPSRS